MDYISRSWVSLALGLSIGAIGAIGTANSTIYVTILVLLAILFWLSIAHLSRLQICLFISAMLGTYYCAPSSKSVTDTGTLPAPRVAQIIHVHYTDTGAILTMENPAVDGGILYRLQGDTEELFVNRKVHLVGQISRTRPSQNPGGFDAQAWALTLGATWQFRGHIASIIPDSVQKSWRTRLTTLSRNQVSNGQHWYGRQVLKGLLLGDRTAVPNDALKAFKNTGTAHLLAVSGLHIGGCAWAVWALFCFLGQRFRLTYPHRLAGFVSILVTILFLMIAQAPLSAQRAAVMICYALVGGMIGRPVPSPRLVAMAVLVVLVPNPQLVTHPGFQFSFGAVIALVTLCRGFKGVKAWIAVAFIASIATWPIQVWHFGTLCPAAPLTNLILTPLASLIVVPVGLLGLALSPLTQLPLDFAAVLAEFLVSIADVFADWGAGVWVTGRWPSPIIALLPVLMLTVGYRYIQLLAMLTLTYAALVGMPPRHYVDFISVGQGDSILLVSDNRAALIDAGPSARASAIVGHLHRMGLARLEWVAITHHHPDHFAGLPFIMKHLDVGAIRHFPTRDLPKNWSLMVAQNNSLDQLARPIESGDTQLGSLHIRTYEPTKSRWVSENDRSVAFRVDGLSQSILLTGDLEGYGEFRLSQSLLGQIDILKLGHHGSRTSTSSQLVDLIRPRLAIASCGINNRYGFPHQDILYELVRREIPVLTTARDGLIRVDMGSASQAVKGYGNRK
jgi:competence protein ComEC